MTWLIVGIAAAGVLIVLLVSHYMLEERLSLKFTNELKTVIDNEPGVLTRDEILDRLPRTCARRREYCKWSPHWSLYRKILQEYGYYPINHKNGEVWYPPQKTVYVEWSDVKDVMTIRLRNWNMPERARIAENSLRELQKQYRNKIRQEAGK